MAWYYVYSGAAGSADGSSWANAYTTLAAALTAHILHDFWVADDHAETQATALTLTFSNTSDTPNNVVCVRRSGGSVPPVSADLRTTATISTTGGAALNINRNARIYGISFTAGNTTISASITFNSGNSDTYIRLESCALILGGTNTASTIRSASGTNPSTATRIECINTTVQFANASQKLSPKLATWLFTGLSVTGGTLPTTLIIPQTTGASIVRVRASDLSSLGSGNTLVDMSSTGGHEITFDSCKLGASVALTTGTIPNPAAIRATFINCDSGDTNYRYTYTDYQGTVSSESVIVRTGGASDGTTGISRKMVSTANSRFYSPLELGPLVTWNDSTSSLTVTVHVVTDNVTLTDAECWIEVEELGTSGYPLSVTQSDRAADILATPANQSTSTETWTTTGLTTPVYQKLNVTFTPAEKGPIKVRVMLAKASTTVYVCPKVEVS